VLEIELETRTLPEVEEALAVVEQGVPTTGRICRIMLDNMSLDTMRQVCRTSLRCIINGAGAQRHLEQTPRKCPVWRYYAPSLPQSVSAGGRRVCGGRRWR
jgi:hypothetical protein